MERSGLTLFINNGWYLPALSGGDLHVMEVATRWAQTRSVGIAMPGWAYRLHSERLDGVRPFDTGRFEGAPPWPFAGVCLRWALRTVRLPSVRPTLVVAASQYPYDLIPGLLVARRSGSEAHWASNCAALWRGLGKLGPGPMPLTRMRGAKASAVVRVNVHNALLLSV